MQDSEHTSFSWQLSFRCKLQINIMEFKTLVINDNEKLCYVNKEPINLTKNEYNLLVYLLSNINVICSREDVIDNVWKKPVNLRAVDTVVSRLRKKIREYNKNIVSRTGFGYGFMENID